MVKIKSVAKGIASKSASLIGSVRHSRVALYALSAASALFITRMMLIGRVYLVTLFAMIAVIASRFTRNMPTILGVALVATALVYKLKRRQYFEGMESKKKEGMEDADADDGADEPDTEDDMRDDEFNAAIAAVKETGDVDAAKELIKSGKAAAAAKKDAKAAADADAPAEAFKPSTSKFTETAGSSPSRIDYASTLEGSYNYLDKILSSEGIGKLTGDTQRLMQQQRSLFDTMSNMTSMLSTTKDMMSSLNVSGLGDLAASLAPSK